MPAVLAGDVGGTKTLLGLFDPAPARPRPFVVRAFSTLDFDNLPSMIAAFLRDDAAKGVSIATGCFGVAGPVLGDSAALTNVPWRVDGPRVAAAFGLSRVRLLNDLQAMAYAVPVLRDAEIHVLQEGEALRGGNIAVIAAGTGLGEALLHNVDGRFVPSPSEGGHADFAARSERDVTVMRDVTSRFGRAEVEDVVSGRGLVNIHRALHGTTCSARIDLDDPEAPAAISAAALQRTSPCCVETLDLFVDAYGAEAGNLALRTVSTGGVFVGGGIAPKILPALTGGAFTRAFRAKAPFELMLERIPVKVIMNPESALLGAAVHAASG
ncbi:MAG: glucokinase [Gemmatimonadales bacterium]